MKRQLDERLLRPVTRRKGVKRQLDAPPAPLHGQCLLSDIASRVSTSVRGESALLTPLEGLELRSFGARSIKSHARRAAEGDT